MNFDHDWSALQTVIAVLLGLAAVGVIAVIIGIVWLFTHVTIGVQP